MKQKFTLVLFIVLSCLSKFNTAKAQVNVQDSLELVNLYTSTNGPGWSNHTNWLTGAPVSSWYGITVTGNRVSQIYFQENNLNGSLPSSVGNLINLETLVIQYNQLTGNIPSSIGNLLSLKSLSLYSNHLSGNIPSSITSIIGLRQLNLGANSLSGKIPATIGNLKNLIFLYLDNNMFTGRIPNSLNELSILLGYICSIIN